MNQPNVLRRKYNYEDLYQEYLKTNSYSSVGRKFGLDKVTVREIIKRHKRFL